MSSNKPIVLDKIDRIKLSELAQNADRTLAELTDSVSLSAPAIHERVKKLRALGCIKRNVALLDGAKIGKPFLAFVHISTKGWGKSRELMELENLPEVEEMHSVAGDTCILLKVRTASNVALEGLLERIYSIPSVVSTKSYVVLTSYIERPVHGSVTIDLDA